MIRRYLAMRSALRLIANHGHPEGLPDTPGHRANNCETFTGLQVCRTPQSGRERGARYGVDAWCPACIAADGLGLPLPSEVLR